MPDTITPNYTKEEIDAAKKELASMKPEDLLALQIELQLAQDALNLPEAPAIAFLELRAPSGAKINLTVRAGSGSLVLDALAQAVAHARDRYSMSTVGQPISNAPIPTREELPLPTDESAKEVSGPPIIINTPGLVSTPSPIASLPTSSTEEIPVEGIMREHKRDGKGDFLRVRGGKYTKYGVPCYPEKFPTGLDVSQMPYGVEYNNIPPTMRVAIVTTNKPFHVIGFHG